ncbi:MAG: hypothetical protein GXP31_06545 [Kiritimatiellaeota bacterium]|nr:hypothetical protein [Kiritimatiellota bacterium]
MQRLRNAILAILVITVVFAATGTLAAEELLRSGTRWTMDLNGTWQTRANGGVRFSFPPPADGWKEEAVPHGPASLLVPHSIYMVDPRSLLDESGEKFVHHDRASCWFRRRFRLGARPAGTVAFVRFASFGFRITLWVNGRRVGESVLGCVPQRFDVTDALNWGGDNELVVGLTGREGILDRKHLCFIAPAEGVAGLTGDVTLRVLPGTYIDDVFIRTSVNKKHIDCDVTVRNLSDGPVTCTPRIAIEDAGEAVKLIPGSAVTVSAGGAKTVTLGADWIAPILWAPATPKRYTAHTVLVGADRKTLDAQHDLFGFREFEIRGFGFYLNGKRIRLLRQNAQARRNASFERVWHSDPRTQGLRHEFGHPINNWRVWGPNPKTLEMMDRCGMLASPCFFSFIEKAYNPEHSAAWLPNIKKAFEQLVRLNRNRPSVIMWNLTNETYWNRVPEKPELYKPICSELVDLVRRLDPTRPLDADAENGWDGLLDVISIHYPEGTAGPVRREYPNSGLVQPNDFYWLNKNKRCVGWRSDFVWDRPLSLGEYWHLSGSVQNYCSLSGEGVYDWEEWRRRDRQDRQCFDLGYNAFTTPLERQTDVYRLLGVACLNPWSGNRERVMPSCAVRPLEFHPNFFSGEKMKRKLVAFYDSDYRYVFWLQSTLRIDGKTVWRDRRRLGIRPGETKSFDVEVPLPEVKWATSAELLWRMVYVEGGGWHEKWRHQETIFIMPRASLAGFEPPVAVLDTNGRTVKALKSLGLKKIRRIHSVDAAALKDVRLLVVGEQTPFATGDAAIERFVRAGGRALILRQVKWETRIEGLPELDDRHVATRTWPRDYSHPALAGLDERQFSYWRPDNFVGKLNFYKAADGRTRVLVDAGGINGLEWMPLAETPIGRGVIVCSQLMLCDRIDVEPMAGEMLSRLVRRIAEWNTVDAQPVVLMAGVNAALRKALDTCNIEVAAASSGPVLIDGSAELGAAQIDELKGRLAAGGTVWLHNVSPEQIGKFAPLLPFPPEVRPIDKTVQSVVRRSSSSVLDGLCSGDFFWTKVDLAARMGFFQRGAPSARIGRWELVIANPQRVEALTAPILLARIPVDKGMVLFDNVEWENALSYEARRASRVVCSLARNLGARIVPAKVIPYDYFYVDLSRFANMGYYDEKADDGKGGWTDMGKSDMCYFLINHTGVGAATGMPVEVKAFPEHVKLGGRPFELTAPAKNNGKAIISLRGVDRRLKLPDRATGIPVGRKADKLWFLQSAAYPPKENVPGKYVRKKGNPVVAKYVFHYADGTTAEFPLRWEIDINDYFRPTPCENARIAWSGRNRVHGNIGMYVTEWNNPHGDKVIESLDLIGAFETTQVVLIGVTGGSVAKGRSGPRALYEWDFGKFADGAAPSSVPGRLPMTAPAHAKAPTPVPGGVRFGADPKQMLASTATKDSPLPGVEPFVLEAAFIPEAIPEGQNGNCIFQSMRYRKSGFRLGMARDMRLWVETWPGPEKHFMARSRVQLLAGRDYVVRIKWDGEKVMIYVNGKLDAAAPSPLPAAYTGSIVAGNGSGCPVFSGILRRIAVYPAGG